MIRPVLRAAGEPHGARLGHRDLVEGRERLGGQEGHEDLRDVAVQPLRPQRGIGVPPRGIRRRKSDVGRESERRRRGSPRGSLLQFSCLHRAPIIHTVSIRDPYAFHMRPDGSPGSSDGRRPLDEPGEERRADGRDAVVEVIGRVVQPRPRPRARGTDRPPAAPPACRRNPPTPSRALARASTASRPTISRATSAAKSVSCGWLIVGG